VGNPLADSSVRFDSLVRCYSRPAPRAAEAVYRARFAGVSRALTRELLSRITEIISVQPAYFAEMDDLRLAAELREAASGPLLGAGVSVAGVRLSALRRRLHNAFCIFIVAISRSRKSTVRCE
jgi:hypothetical protein